jgi:NADPH:quinone reductase-like Zn-dependent oxidoreductase
MKALVATAYGDVDKLTVADVPEPQIGPGDVKVQVQAASINPMDWKLLSGEARTVMELHFPAILGRLAGGGNVAPALKNRRRNRFRHVLRADDGMR